MKKKTSSTPPGVTSRQQKVILQKLTTLEELLKKKDDKPLTFKDACAYLGYAPSYLYKLTYRKVIPYYKPTGKLIFFSKNELDQWIFKGNGELRIENSELKEDDTSASLGIKDPNQMEMELKDASTGSAQEIVVEFPRKKRK